MDGRGLTVIAVMALLMATAGADDREQTVEFDTGKSSTVLKGEVSGRDSMTYVLDAAERQVLSIRFAPAHPACFMNVWPPGADAATHVGSVNGNEFVANLARVGQYRVQAYLVLDPGEPAARCAYEIAFHRTRAGSAVPLPTVPQGRDALRGAIEKCMEMVGVPAEIVETNTRGPGLFELVLRERDSQHRSACTVREDGTIEDWSER